MLCISCRVDGYIDTLSRTSLPEPCGQLNCVQDIIAEFDIRVLVTYRPAGHPSSSMPVSKDLEPNWNLELTRVTSILQPAG